MTIRLHPRLTALVAVILAVAWMNQTPAAGESPDPNARLAADARSFTISTAGFDDFRATWSATIRRDGAPERVLASTEGVVTPGPVTTIRFPEENIELLFQLESRTDAPAVMARVGIRNTGTAPVKLLWATPVMAEWKLPANLNGWFLTGFHPQTPFLQVSVFSSSLPKFMSMADAIIPAVRASSSVRSASRSRFSWGVSPGWGRTGCVSTMPRK